jgi:hypothetical protein
MNRKYDFFSIKKPSGEFFFDWQDPVDRELLDRAFDIVKPRDRLACADLVSWRIQFLRWFISSGALEAAKYSSSAARRKKLTNSALVIRQAATILRSHLPRNPLEGTPFGQRPSPRQLTSVEKKLLARIREQKAAIIFLEFQASEWEEIARERATSTKTPDFLKQQCARFAYDTLCLTRCRPTLTAEGPFFLLAALYYESATGQADGNLERACRAEFARPKSADDSREFAKSMRQ